MVVPSRVPAAAFSLLLLLEVAAAAGPFSGSVLDGITLKPIKGAVITTPDGASAKSDRHGAFAFLDLPSGDVTFTITAPGYETGTEDDTLVDAGERDHVFILFTPGATSETITVEEHAPVPPAPGKQDLGRQEITRIPGSRGDALTAVRNLPGIGAAPAMGQGPSNVVIRGAAPEDSKVTLDGIEIPVLYHFFALQSVLPSEMIENIEFLPGGFGAEEGGATGGVINIVTRDEAVGKTDGFAELSFINFAGLIETPISKAHHLQLTAAARRSTIDLILPAVIPKSANLAFTTAPQYYDGQVRLDWRPRETDRASLFALTSYDLLGLLSDNVSPNEPAFAGKFSNMTSFTRLLGTWEHGKEGRSNRLTVAGGFSSAYLEIGTARYLRFGQQIGELRDDARFEVNDHLILRAGMEGKDDARDVHVKFPAPPAEGQPPPTNFSNAPLVTYDTRLHNNIVGAYAAGDLRPVKSLVITPGLRFDHYFHLGKSTVTPRLQVTQDIGPKWTAKLAMGAYTRGLENAESADPYLDPERAFQYVLGGEWKPKDGLSVETSVFYTDREQLVVTDALEAKTDPLFAYVNRGVGRSYGAELLARAKLESFFGWIAYTLSRSDRIDGPGEMQRLFDYDQTHNLIVVGSYTWKQWQFGGRFQYATGTPTTPVVGSLYLSDVNAFIPVYGTVNSDRLEAQHELDLRVDRAWKFKTWSLSTYLDVTNVYAHAAVQGYSYNYDYTERKAITQLPIVPALGVRGSF